MLKSLFLLSLVVFLVSCGKKDSIKVETEVQRLGDGEYVTQNVLLPLSDKVVGSYDDSTENLNPLARGFIRTIMNVGASLGAGRTRLSLTQRLPEKIPDIIGSIKIKRIFFVLDNKDEESKKSSDKKKENENLSLDFLNALALKMSIQKFEYKDSSWEPIVENASLNEIEKSWLKRNVNKIKKNAVEDQTTLEEWDDQSEGLKLLQYDQVNKRKEKTKLEKYTYVMSTSDPKAAREYFLNADELIDGPIYDKDGNEIPKRPYFKPLIQKLTVLNKSLLIEINPNEVDRNIFLALTQNDNQRFAKMHSKFAVCASNCLELDIKNVNFLPMLKTGNALRVDAYIDPKEAPKTFQLKGYIEFEVKIKSAI